MAQNKIHVQVDETLHRNGDRIVEAEYVYRGTHPGGEIRTYRASVKRQDYDGLTATTTKTALPFDKFMKVLRPFMMGHHAAADIPEAFHLLDTDHSGTIDIGELAAFMPVIVPDGNPHMLLHHVQKVDQNNDYKLNLAEFTALCNRGIGRDIVVNRL